MANYDNVALAILAEMKTCNIELFNGDFEKFQSLADDFSKMDKKLFINPKQIIIELISLLDDKSEQEINMYWVLKNVFEFLFQAKLSTQDFTQSFFQGIEKIINSLQWSGEILGGFITDVGLINNFEIVLNSIPKLSVNSLKVISEILDESSEFFKNNDIPLAQRYNSLKSALLAHYSYSVVCVPIDHLQS